MAKKKKEIKAIVEYSDSEAKNIVTELIKWLKEKPENFIIDEFLLIEKGIFKNDIEYLKFKNADFLKMMEEAEAIELTKLQKFALGDRLNASIAKQILINKYGWL